MPYFNYPSLGMSKSVYDPNNVGADAFDSANHAIDSISGATYDSVQDVLQTEGSTGLIVNGTPMTDGGSETIDVAAFKAAIRVSNDRTARKVAFDFAGETGVAIATDTTKYVGIEYNSGTPRVSVRSSKNWNGYDDWELGIVVNDGGTLHIYNNPDTISNGVRDIIYRLSQTTPLEYSQADGGLRLGNTGTRNITLTGGKLYCKANPFDISAIDTSASDTFASYYDTTQQESAATQWDNDNYNNGGSLTSLTASKYANLWFYIEADSGEMVMVYGEAQYSTPAAAAEDPVPTTLPPRLYAGGKLVARLMFQKGGSTPISIVSAFETTFQGQAINDHSQLSNLQGGTTAEYYHLTSAQHTIATQAATDSLDGYATSTQITKLDGIEASADVTDAANVASAGAAILTGQAGGQTLQGGTAASENLSLESTAHSTKGSVILKDNLTTPDPGTDTASKSIELVANNSGTLQYSTIQTQYGASPYLRISVPSVATGAATALIDISETQWNPAKSGVSIGHASNKFVDITISGNINVDGTVDGRDVATDGGKLDGIEASADVTDAGNVGSSIAGASAKATPVDADSFGLIDSADSDALKETTMANLKAYTSPAASKTASGIVELATTAEIDTGTDTTRAVPVDQFVASKRNIRWLIFNLVEKATDCEVATNIAGDYISPIAGTILQSDTTPFYLYATNTTAGTTGTMVVDISIGGTSIMTTNKLDFDSTEKTTTTASTPPDLTTTSLSVGDVITIDVDSIHTTAAKGLTVYMAVRES